jgi:hypothetical protein
LTQNAVGGQGVNGQAAQVALETDRPPLGSFTGFLQQFPVKPIIQPKAGVLQRVQGAAQ